VANGWCWFLLREEYCWLVAGGWFVVREKYCWLLADKPSEQGASVQSFFFTFANVVNFLPSRSGLKLLVSIFSITTQLCSLPSSEDIYTFHLFIPISCNFTNLVFLLGHGKKV
jgi:hypothetical protein